MFRAQNATPSCRKSHRLPQALKLAQLEYIWIGREAFKAAICSNEPPSPQFPKYAAAEQFEWGTFRTLIALIHPSAGFLRCLAGEGRTRTTPSACAELAKHADASEVETAQFRLELASDPPIPEKIPARVAPCTSANIVRRGLPCSPSHPITPPRTAAQLPRRWKENFESGIHAFCFLSRDLCPLVPIWPLADNGPAVLLVITAASGVDRETTRYPADERIRFQKSISQGVPQNDRFVVATDIVNKEQYTSYHQLEDRYSHRIRTHFGLLPIFRYKGRPLDEIQTLAALACSCVTM